MIVGLLLGLLILALAVLVLAGVRIEHLQWESKDIMDQNHAKCLAMVGAFVGDRFAAQVLMAAAEHYDGMDGQAELRRIVNSVWVEGGPSIPSLWLRDRAEMILEKMDDDAACD